MMGQHGSCDLGGDERPQPWTIWRRLMVLAGALALVLVPVASADASPAQVHGVCYNPQQSNADLLVYCPYFHVHQEPVPELPELRVVFKIHANATPQSFHMVVYLYKWPAEGGHADVYRFCLGPTGELEDCKRVITLGDLPQHPSRNLDAEGSNKVYTINSICQPGRYYVEFDAHGVSSSGRPDIQLWYDPHPSNRSDYFPPNRQESHHITTC